ncbi:cytohesin-1 isoform X3 [Vespula squamosa]|uniref:Cytohesin-1 isoform X3 n=1 Tax=Vespula squamosa TaxID=30214 RepID=A0ABD2A7B4_VESSQ
MWQDLDGLAGAGVHSGTHQVDQFGTAVELISGVINGTVVSFSCRSNARATEDSNRHKTKEVGVAVGDTNWSQAPERSPPLGRLYPRRHFPRP